VLFRSVLQREGVADHHFDRAAAVVRAARRHVDAGRHPVLGEELLHRDRRQLDAQHPVPAFGQPQQVQRLAAQRHQHPAALRREHLGPVLLQQRRRPVLVEGGPGLAPTLLPEIGIHARPRGYATDSPSTFCQPRGNRPPRVARLPRYCSRSLNDSVIVRAPECTASDPPGGTTAMATTRSVPSLALGMSMILLPLPLSSSGSSDSGNASRWPALVTATMRSSATLVTGAGCSSFAPGVSVLTALPAFCRPTRFSKRVTKP